MARRSRRSASQSVSLKTFRAPTNADIARLAKTKVDLFGHRVSVGAIALTTGVISAGLWVSGLLRPTVGYVNGIPFPLFITNVGDGEFASLTTAHGFKRMKNAASNEAGFDLGVSSGFRGFFKQALLYAQREILGGPETAAPGYSNHQAGTALDLTESGKLIASKGSAVYKWLADNASRFGFVNDVSSEPWHWHHTG